MELKDEAPYTVCQTSDYYYIQCLTGNTVYSPTRLIPSPQIPSSAYRHLQISRRTNKLVQISAQSYNSHLEQVPVSRVVKCYLIMGTIIINQEPYLLLASDAEKVAIYIDYPVFNVTDVMFLAYRNKKYQKEEDNKEEEKIMEVLGKNYLPGNFYFSYKENITSVLVGRENKDDFEFNQYAWNANLLESFLKSKVDKCWAIPVIQGFVAQISKSTQHFSWQYLSISRRSSYMSGTRFNSRGLDSQAHASNFVQTQQIIKCHNFYYVHVGIRGSVPLFWSQQKVRGSIVFGRDCEMDEEGAMREHYRALEERYQASVITINLLSRDKSPEKELKNRLEALLARNKELPYLYFDLNLVMEDSSDGQMAINKFVAKKREELFGKNSFSILQSVTLEVKQRQSIVPRVNCLDCLDRTNVMLARISEVFVYEVANKINKQVEVEQKQLKIKENVVDKLIRIWAVLGDRISKMYCGTGSVAAHMTLKQNNSILSTLGGALTSFSRYLNATHTDLFKQKCIDSLLGQRGELSKPHYFTHNIFNSQLKEAQYSTFTQIDISIITFNTGHLNLSQQGGTLNVESFLGNAITNIQSQMVVVELQEVEGARKWGAQLEEGMSKREYTLLAQGQTLKSELLSFVFVRKNISVTFKYIQTIDIPLRSNGGLALFVQANSSLLCFLNIRFQGGFLNRYLRLDDFNQLHVHLLKQTYSSQLLQQSQAVFLAGDFNLRLSNNIDKQFKFKNTMENIWSAELGNREDLQLIREGLGYDELDTLKKSQFFQYLEAEIGFYPTYCFSIKKGGFDKAKPPAWCDRIFYVEPGYARRRGGACTPIICKCYNRIEQRLCSSHKGVLGCFKMSIRRDDQKLKKELGEKYLFEKEGEVKEQMDNDTV